jgi:hypothetical protein
MSSLITDVLKILFLKCVTYSNIIDPSILLLSEFGPLRHKRTTCRPIVISFSPR